MVQIFNSYIDEKDLPYIFERFYRSDKSRQNDGKSFGLGLAITKEMVDKLNGEIKILSNKDNGTIFSVKFH